ncbi:MAG: restriction endonuclease subunit S [Magnetococcales bacterium]|nr:restriction endonuclease subunit S [Magnetococcales bacterium]
MKPGWRMVKCGDVVHNANLTVRNLEKTELNRVVGLEHIDPENLHIRRWDDIADGTSFTRRFVPGQTLFGKRRAYQKKVAYAEFDGICSGDILTFESKDHKTLLPELLPFIVQSDGFFEYALGTSAGSLSPRTSWTALQNYEFPLPPIEEQCRIAEILWAADEVVERYLQSRFQIQETISTIFRQLVANTASLKKRIGDLGTVITGSTPSTKNPIFYNKREFMFVSPSDIGSRKYVTSTEKMVSSEGLQTGREIPENAVMVVCIGSTTGKVAVSSERCITNQQINTIVCNKDADPDFVYRLLKLLGDHLYQQASCTALPILNKSQFSSIEVPIPSLQNQKYIIEIIGKLEYGDSSINQHIANTRTILDKAKKEWGTHG